MRVRAIWVYPYAFMRSIPYFIQDMYNVFEHMYNNIEVISSQLLCVD